MKDASSAQLLACAAGGTMASGEFIRANSERRLIRLPAVMQESTTLRKFAELEMF
jgi:hypothetical protein